MSPPSEEITVWIASHRSPARRGLAEILSEVGLHVAAETTTLARTLDALAATPDARVLVVGLRPWMEVLDRATAERPDLRVLVLSGLDEREVGPVALRAGAAGFVSRRNATRDLVVAVRYVTTEDTPFMSRELSGHMAAAYASGMDLAELGVVSQLSPREVQTLRLYARGLKRREVAEGMGISPRTVTSHRQNLLDKLGLATNADLVRFAIRHGLVDLEE